MTTTCPKCRHVRLPHEQAPAWQCPACGVAYAKAGEAALVPEQTSRLVHRPEPEQSIAWGKWLAGAAVVCGVWLGYQRTHHGADAEGAIGSLRASFKGDASEAELRKLAASVRSGEVVMYTTTECSYCAQAKSWMNQYGFAFDECNMSVSARCEREFRGYGGTGTPYLVIRGRHMKDGFDSDEFMALLKP